jgi:cell wall-associated NlpC family hydrolase
MKNYRILSLIAVVLTMSILSSYVFADGGDENDRKNDGPIEETQIDEDLNRQILEYLENLDESELDPNRNEDHYEHRSDKEIIEQWEQEEREHPCGIEELPVLDDSNPPDRDTDPTGFYSIGSDLYYTDPVTNVRYCNTTLTYEHIVFTFGSDYKVTSIVPVNAYSSNRRVKILLEAFNWIGTPYALYSDMPDEFSCGGYVAYVYLKALGVDIGVGSWYQIYCIDQGITSTINADVNMEPEEITESELLPGDVIYWNSPVCAARQSACPYLSNHPSPCPFLYGIHHSAIYIGNGQVAESASGRGVIVGDIRDMTANGLTIYRYVRYINEDVALNAVTDLQAEPAGKHKVSLEWTSNRYTDGYLIYSRKNNVYAYCGMTRVKYEVSPQQPLPTPYPNQPPIFVEDLARRFVSRYLDDKALSSGNGYYVFPYVTDYSGTMYPGTVSIMVSADGICTAVPNLTLTEQVGSIKLDWGSSAEAEGYLIYGIRGGGTYGYIGMTSGNSNTTYIDNMASTTLLNRYWVFPFFYEGGAVVPGVQSEEVNGYAH